MIGVIDVGGGFRGSYGAGVLDYCMTHNIVFDYGIGVSAGSANIASYLGHQYGRNYVFYLEYLTRPDYMGIKPLLKTGRYIGLDYIYGDLSDSDGEYPLDWKAIEENPAPLWVVATDADTGQPVYFDKSSMKQDAYDAIKASCNVPVVDKPFEINGRYYYDGGISDPVPLKKAFADGCDRVVLILTKPKDFRRNPEDDRLMAKLLEKRHPAAARDMANRAIVYNRAVDEAVKLEKEGKVLIVAPESTGAMKTLNKKKSDIRELYIRGYRDAMAVRSFAGQ